MFKKLKLMFFYIKMIKKHTKDIRNYFIENSKNFTYEIKDIEYDYAYRLYTVVNMRPNTTSNIQKYGQMMLDNENKKFLSELHKQLKKYGLFELVGLERADRISTNSVLIVVRFKYIKITKLLKTILLSTILLILSAILLLII